MDQDPGTYQIQVETKGGHHSGIITLEYVGDIASVDGFTVEFLSKTDNGDGTYTYAFKVTNNNDRGLSHVAFGLPCLPNVMLVNEGATVVVDNLPPCEMLVATTESIIINICCIDNGIGTILPTLPYSTPWAEDFCEFCCDCD